MSNAEHGTVAGQAGDEARLTRLVAREGASPRAVRAFRRHVLAWYRANGRDLPWRHCTDPYAVLVSEIMLQQTQVNRVCGRWERFIERFPAFEALAAAPLSAVLDEWHGLGYNRRAAHLRSLAQIVVSRHGGVLPCDEAGLRRLPGLGKATAASVAVFACGSRAAFIETNIRAVYLHVFFAEREGVRDDEILPIAVAALPGGEVVTWHWALMDYGAALKRAVPNPSRRSAHHATQSRFEGSVRQLRGRVLRALVTRGPLADDELDDVAGGDRRLDETLSALERDGLIIREDEVWRVA